RRVFAAQPARDVFVERGDARTRIEQEQRRLGLADRLFGPHADPAWPPRRALILEPRRVDEPELEPGQLPIAPTPRTRHPRRVTEEREALADQPVQQRRFADIGPADYGDRRGSRHASFLSVGPAARAALPCYRQAVMRPSSARM